tara:strand:+ start:56 stop:907 length:852 start_codon:yes stop_codon:yes gene_type:complete
MKLSDKALLVQLNISQWTARKYDKRATEQVAQQNGSASQAGRYNKSLLPMNDALNNIHQKSTLIRKKFYTNTLPWGIEGTMMLPSANYLNFMTEFRNEKADWQSLVDTFYHEYPRLHADAQRFLGNLYNQADYPELHDIQRKFNMDMAVFPVPSNDFRVSIGDAELEKIQQDVEARVENSAQQAMKEAWQRLYDRVKHMADKLADPKAVFRDTLVENTKEVCSILSRLNFADDPDLETMRQQVEGSLANNHPESLRNDPDLRRHKAEEARAIMDKMGAFMGGN